MAGFRGVGDERLDTGAYVSRTGRHTGPTLLTGELLRSHRLSPSVLMALLLRSPVRNAALANSFHVPAHGRKLLPPMTETKYCIRFHSTFFTLSAMLQNLHRPRL